jgi:hypothetical protein
MCVHSCERVREEKSEIYLLSPSSAFSLSRARRYVFLFSFFNEENRLKFFLRRSRTYTHFILLVRLYTVPVDKTSSYEISESKSQTSREDDGNDNRREEKRKKKWTMDAGLKESKLWQ